MKTPKVKLDLDKRFQKVIATPASFTFFEAIHDFIEHIEKNPALSGALSHRIKINRELDIPNKYDSLKQIYQGFEDAHPQGTKDLGHARYIIIRDLKRIENQDVSDSISFWKKRELFRKFTREIYERLDSHLFPIKSA